MAIFFIDFLGKKIITLTEHLGRVTLFLFHTLKTLCTTQLRVKTLFRQMEQIGVNSFSIIVLTGSFTGMVFALQSYVGLQRMGGEHHIGIIVALGMIRELGPVLTGIMVTGRACSAIAAEIGTMRITEQIDALTTLRINVFQYLIVPRILGSTIILPFLTLFSMIFGIIGGFIICAYVLELNPDDYVNSIVTYVELSDINGGLIKSTIFGLILGWIGSYKGFHANGGAYGVGKATTQSVVNSSILILMSNYFLTKLLEHL